MRRIWTFLIAVLAVLPLAGCAFDMGNRPIPAGTYYHETTDEWIRVDDTTVFLHVRYTDPRMDGAFIDRAYRYRVGRVDHIFIGVSSNDPTYLEYFLNPWYWRDGAILKQDPETGETAWFRRR